MYEYEIVRIARHKEQKTKEVEVKRGKFETQKYTEVETFDEFDARIKKTLNDFGSEGWQVISANYSLPIQGHASWGNSSGAGWSTTDFNSAEFVVVMQRSK